MSNMRVVFVGPFGMRPRGTMSVRALPLARALVARGHTVTLLLPPWQNPEDAGKIVEIDGVRIENMTLPHGVPGWFHLWLTLALTRRALALRPDIVHVFKPKAYAGLTHWMLHTFRRRLPVVVDTDDWEGPGGWNDIAPYPAPLKHFFTWQERWGLTHASAVTVASRALETLVWSLGVPPRQVVYLPNGVAWAGPPVEPAPHRRPTLLLYTRFFEFDLERLWSVLWQVRDARPEARVWVVGQGFAGEELELMALAREAGWRVAREPDAEADLIYAGWVAPETLPDHFAQVDVALYPFNDTLVNRTKCPVKLLDLLAAGVPVVGEAVGQIGDMIASGETGMVMPPHDEPGLVWALLSLLGDAERRAEMRARAAADVRARFAWAQLAGRVEEVYTRLVKRDA